MLERVKPGSGRIAGDDHQIWVGVKIILDWFNLPCNESNYDTWLREEIGFKKYGIFDDIQVCVNGKYEFYQVKKSITAGGNCIDENTLTDGNSDLKIRNMYDSYLKIKDILKNNGDFRLIICSDRVITGDIRECIDQGKFSESFTRNSVKKDEKKKVRKMLFEACGSPDNFEDFLKRIHFTRINAPETEVRKLLQNRPDIIGHLYELVKNNALFEFDGKTKKIYYSNVSVMSSRWYTCVMPPRSRYN